MSKADTLRETPAFGAARSARSARSNAIRKVTGGDQAATEAITELPVTLVSDNPDNPRNHLRNLDETTESVREVGIILPIVVATVEAYLRDRPDRTDDLDDGAQYVVVDGHRRLEAARRVGLATIPVRVDNARVATDASLLEAAFVANYHRDDMTDLEEAHALKQLVDYYGSQTKACKRLGIAQSTLSSKLSLLKLTPELQKGLMTGERKAEHVRNLGKLSADEQRQKADERAASARQKTEQAGRHEDQRVAGPANYHGVIIPDGAVPSTVTRPTLPEPPAAALRQQSPPAGPAAESIPEPRTGPLPSGKPLPYDDGVTIGHHLALKMDQQPFADAARVMAQQCWDKAGLEPSFDLLRAMLETAAKRDRERLLPLLKGFLADNPH